MKSIKEKDYTALNLIQGCGKNPVKMSKIVESAADLQIIDIPMAGFILTDGGK